MTMEGTNKISLIAKGMIMGIAEVIPGVSGGTIAFITGIYERLLDAIKGIGPSLITEYKTEGIIGLWKAIDGWFLTFLLSGMVIGIGVGAVAITYLLDHYPEPLWAFFFGLIIASGIYIGRKVSHWNLPAIALMILGAVVAYGITTISPVEGSTHPLMLMTAGAIAVSALILPGISGSFILLLMGMYVIVVPTLKEFGSSPSFDEFKILAFFGIGMLIGVAVFSRVLSWTFKNYKNQTLALLTGFMIGSLNKIWPWRNPQVLLDKSTNLLVTEDAIGFIQRSQDLEFKILKEQNVFPADYLMGESQLILVLLVSVLGFLSVFALSKFEKS